MPGMQFGIFTVGDVTSDPTTGRAPSEAERIKATVRIALKAEEVGVDVFATGEHHNPPFVPSSPTTLLGFLAPRTPASHTQRLVGLYRERFAHYGRGTAEQAVVGLGGQVFMRRNSQDAVNEFRPYFDHAPVYGNGPSLEEFTTQTPLTVGSPQQVSERTLGFRDCAGD